MLSISVCSGCRGETPCQGIQGGSAPLASLESGANGANVACHFAHLRKYNNCRTVGDVLDLSDADILSMRFSGPKTLFELRVGLLEIVGGVLELHEYFYDPDVVRYIQDVRIGMVAKNALLDSRKWMASLYYSKISRMKKGSDYR